MVTISDMRDEGFTLTELVIVVALLAIILGITYTGLNVVTKAAEVSQRQSTFADEVGAPLLGMEEVLQQAFAFETADAYTLTVRTDADNDNLVERHTITASTAGVLTHEAWRTNSLMQNTTLWIDTTWSRNNVNAKAGVAEPLFYYYDDARPTPNRITNTAGNLDKIKMIDVVDIVEVNGKRYRGTRTIVLRNR